MSPTLSVEISDSALIHEFMSPNVGQRFMSFLMYFVTIPLIMILYWQCVTK